VCPASKGREGKGKGKGGREKGRDGMPYDLGDLETFACGVPPPT